MSFYETIGKVVVTLALLTATVVLLAFMYVISVIAEAFLTSYSRRTQAIVSSTIIGLILVGLGYFFYVSL